MKIISALLALNVLLIVACKNDNTKTTIPTSNTPTVATKPEMPREGLQTVSQSPPVYGKVDEAFTKLSGSTKAFAMITDSVWHFHVAITMDSPDPVIFRGGEWLDLLENGEYNSGVYNEVKDQGRLTYDEKTTILEMRSSKRDTSSQWRVKVDPDAMLLIGTSAYRNNPWQFKFNRAFARPNQQ